MKELFAKCRVPHTSRTCDVWVFIFTGDKVTRLLNEQGDNSLGYDDLGRLSSRALTSGGSGPTLSWTYDRFGNRLSQSAGGTGGSAPQITLGVDTGSNRVQGYTYDQAGNVLNDGVHLYTYDQEGNLVYVDNGTTTWDNYDALNRRIMHVTGNNTNYLRYEYGIDGKLAGVWQNEETYEKLNRYYGPKGDSFAYWTGGTNLSNEVVHYQHTDYLGTVKARTDGNHNIEGSYSDLPFGERTAASGTDDNTEHYATLDRDSESDTHHAQFRTYEPRIGRWLQPDPYDGSYRRNNPQSFNRYSYVLNNPLGFIDRFGLNDCVHGDAGGTDGTSPCAGEGVDCNSPYATCVSTEEPCWVCLVGAPGGGDTGSDDGRNDGPGASSAGTTDGNTSDPPISCSTKLPDGRTVGDYVRDGVADIRANLYGATNTASLVSSFIMEVTITSSIDFHNRIGDTPQTQQLLGDAGNFAYYAIGSAFMSKQVLHAGAAGYGLISAILPTGRVHFSQLTFPGLQDDSAASQEDAGYEAAGCQVR